MMHRLLGLLAMIGSVLIFIGGMDVIVIVLDPNLNLTWYNWLETFAVTLVVFGGLLLVAASVIGLAWLFAIGLSLFNGWNP